MIRRQKTTIFTDCKETTPVIELKRIIEGITKVLPDNQKLYKDDQVMEDSKLLSEYGLNSSTARAQSPATVTLCFRNNSGEFETPEILPLSTPPELPEVMKPQESINTEQAVV